MAREWALHQTIRIAETIPLDLEQAVFLQNELDAAVEKGRQETRLQWKAYPVNRPETDGLYLVAAHRKGSTTVFRDCAWWHSKDNVFTWHKPNTKHTWLLTHWAGPLPDAPQESEKAE